MDRACFAYEVIAIREGQPTLMHDDSFSREEADNIIAYLVTWFFVSNAISAYISEFFFFLLVLLGILVYFVYEFYNKL